MWADKRQKQQKIDSFEAKFACDDGPDHAEFACDDGPDHDEFPCDDGPDHVDQLTQPNMPANPMNDTESTEMEDDEPSFTVSLYLLLSLVI